LDPYQAFKQKTSLLDAAFSRNIASKLLLFTGFSGIRMRFASIFSMIKYNTPKKIRFSVLTVKNLCLVQNRQAVYSQKKKTKQFGLLSISDLAEVAAASIICQIHGSGWKIQFSALPSPLSLVVFNIVCKTCHASLLCDALGGVTAAAGRRFHANFCPRHLSVLHWAVRRQLQGTRIQPLSWCGISCS